MKNFPVIVLSALISLTASANEHQVTALSNYNYQSEGSVGFSAGYQYFFQPNFAVQVGVDHSGELTKLTNAEELYGEFDSIYLGASVKKPFNNMISSFASAGVIYVTDSTNQHLIADDSTLPYLGLGFDLAITDNLSFTFKHQSQFSNQAYQDMHHLSLGFSFSFGKKNKYKVVKTSAIENTKAPSNAEPSAVTEVPMVTKKNSNNKIISAASTSASTVSKDLKPWAIQVGAFRNESNARAFLVAFNNKTEQHYIDSADIIFYQDVFRIIIRRFESKEIAKSWQTSVLTPKQIESYVLQITYED